MTGVQTCALAIWKQLPATLTEDRMVLRNGVQIPWRQFTRLKVTDVYYRRSLVG